MLKQMLTKPLLIVYVMLVVEMFGFALLPKVLGSAIDSLRNGGNMLPYVLLVMIAASVAFFRRVIDTRLFTAAWTKACRVVVGRSLERGVASERVQTQAGLVGRYVDFLEYSVPQLVQGTIQIGVAITMCVRSLPVLVVIGVVTLSSVAATIMVLVSQYQKRIDNALCRTRNNIHGSIVRRDVDRYAATVSKIARLEIRLSDLHAFTHFVADGVGFLEEILVVYLLVRADASVGTIMASAAYVWMINNNIHTLKNGLNSWYRVRVADKHITK